MRALSTLRGVTFGIVIFFSMIVFAFTTFDQVPPFEPDPPDSLSLAAAIITLVFLPITLVLEAVIRSGATSLVPVELVRVFILWVLWLASGAFFYANTHGISASFCARLGDLLDPLFEASCIAAIIIPACSIINFVLLFVWFITLLIFSSKNNHWKSAVNRVDLTKKKGPGNDGSRSNSGFVYGNPPQQQQQQQLQYYWVPGPQGPPPPVHLQGPHPPGQGQWYWVPAPPGGQVPSLPGHPPTLHQSVAAPEATA